MPRSIDNSTTAPTPNPSEGSKIFLIGYRGSGKTTIGRLLAQQLGWSLVDTDAMVIAEAGVSIAEIFREHGESEFRRRETEAIKTAIEDAKPAIVSLGGGAPIQSQNRELIRAAGVSIWLRASAETLWRRIQEDEQSQTQRPDLTSLGGLDEVMEILRIRTPIYQANCDKIVDVDSASPKSIAAELFEWVRGGAGQSDDNQREPS